MDLFIPEFSDIIGPWHNYFCWFPVNTVDQGFKWLTYVKRRRLQLKSHLIPYSKPWHWQYVSRFAPINNREAA